MSSDFKTPNNTSNNTLSTPIVMINVEDFNKVSESEFEKIFEALPILGSITLLENGEPKGVLLSIEEYEKLEAIKNNLKKN